MKHARRLELIDKRVILLDDHDPFLPQLRLVRFVLLPDDAHVLLNRLFREVATDRSESDDAEFLS